RLRSQHSERVQRDRFQLGLLDEHESRQLPRDERVCGFQQHVRSGRPTPGTRVVASGQSAKGSVEGGVDLGMGVRNRGETDTYKSGWYAGGSFYLVHTIHLIGLIGADYRSESGFTANVY